MQITSSELLSSIALLVSVGSAYYSKKQSEYARFSSGNDYKAHLSENHKKYYEALQKVRKRHEEDFLNLSKTASQTLKKIVCLFDEYDIDRQERPLRHLIDEAAEIAYFTVKGQLGWQTGSNISHRFYQFNRVEELLKPTQNISDNESYRESLRNSYFSDKNRYLENAILKDFYFSNLVKQAKRRIDPERTKDLLIKIHGIFDPFEELYRSSRDGFRDSAEKLEGILREGEMEHFSLTESPQIYNAMRDTKATLDVLAHLVIPAVKEEYAHCIYNYTSHSIYTCALLNAVQGLRCWGWR